MAKGRSRRANKSGKAKSKKAESLFMTPFAVGQISSFWNQKNCRKEKVLLISMWQILLRCHHKWGRCWQQVSLVGRYLVQLR